MYRVMDSDGTIIGYVDEPRYIKVSDNGSFIVCDKSEALGVAVNGTAYHLTGKEAVEGMDVDVALFEVANGNVVFDTIVQEAKNTANIDYVAMMTDVELPEDEEEEEGEEELNA